MNNDQFRRLVGANTPKPSSSSNGASPLQPRAVALGSRKTSSIPMTPRSVAGLHRQPDFARQLAEQNQSNKPEKKFRSFAPKGSRLAEGYTDRSQTRNSEEDDDRATRIRALEESLKKEEIDQETFDKLRAEIAGGDLSSTHLVKGLDFKLLERIKQGEDVYEERKAQDDGEEVEPEDVDDEFDRLAEAEIATVEKEQAAKKKKGQLSTVSLNPGKKRTRDQILADMKAARDAAKAAKEQSSLGTKFRKIGSFTPGSRVERDGKGREVLIITDERGNEKRMVRKAQPAAEQEAARARELMMPDKDAKPLGMEVPDIYKQPAAEEPDDADIDIFDDAGDDYDPLAGLSDGSDSSDEDEASEKKKPEEASESAKQPQATEAMPPPPRPAGTTEARNYFKDAKAALVSSETLKAPSMSDPAIQAAFQKAASLRLQRPTTEDEDMDEAARAKAERHRKMLQNQDRDLEDMDMGFGTSRFEDEADFDDDDGPKVKLARWGEDDNDDGDDGKGGKGGGGAKRKRGPKKRKGDANNAADVLRAMEKQRGAK